jgi:hypothetical protein
MWIRSDIPHFEQLRVDGLSIGDAPVVGQIDSSPEHAKFPSLNNVVDRDGSIL